MAAQILAIVEEALDACEVDFYDAYTSQSNIGQTLHVKIDSDKGISAEDCATTAQHLRYHLSAHLKNVDNLNIEVSSPGVERALKNSNHFIKAIGKEIKIKFTNDNDIAETLTGVILNALEDHLILKTDKNELTVMYSSVHNANVLFSTHGSLK